MPPERTDDQSENLPDIDAGLDELSTETTAADLLREQGQRKKIRVINQKQLKAQIQDWIHHALNSVMSENADRLEDSERQALVDQAEARVQELMQRNKQMEAAREQEIAARQQAEERLNRLAAEHGANEELQSSIAQLQERLQKAELVADEAQQDLLVAEQDLENTKKMFQTTLSEKDRLNDTVRQHMRHTTDLVAQVLSLDADYYASKHQEQHPLPEDAEAAQAFYHDFEVGAHVVNTLSQDLTRLREITTGTAEPTEDAGQGQLLERDLELLEQLKAGSLSAVDVAAPVENLVEALEGVRDEVVEIQGLTNAGGTAIYRAISALPEPEGDPAEVLAGLTQVARQLSAALASQKAVMGDVSSQSEDRDKANQALRENMIRTADLVQGVLAVDQEYYGGRHQEEHPADESAEGAEAFYHDFDVGARIIETLRSDLARLRELTKDQEKYSGLLDSDLAMLEQLKTGSLSAVDVAAPVENLLEALQGARDEMVQFQQAADRGEPSARTALAVVPDAEDGDPAEVLAEATQIVRQFSAALAQQRAALGDAGASSEELERANQALRENMVRTADLVQGVLAVDHEYYGDRHQTENPADENAEGSEAFYHDFEVGARIIETLRSDLARLRELTKDQEKYSGLLDSDLAMLEQLKAGSLAAVDVAAPVENLLEALQGAREEMVQLQQAAEEGDTGARTALSAVPDAEDGDPAEVLAGATQVVRQLSAALAHQRSLQADAGVSSQERDKANQALRENMVRTADLVQGVLALDQEYYGGRHQEENPADESAEGSEAFYHDFDVGAQIIQTLSKDLSRLREVTKDQEKYSGLLDSDLAMLEQLKTDSLAAVDVAAPVANLVEALRGARDEAMELRREASEAMGLPETGTPISDLAEAGDDEDPAQVLARSTQIARELAAALANERKRVNALKAMADEADAQRSGTEHERESARALAEGLVSRIAAVGESAERTVPAALTDADADTQERLAAAAEVLEGVFEALSRQRDEAERLGDSIQEIMADEAETDEATAVDPAAELATRVQRLGHAYGILREAYKRSQARNVALADQLQALARDLYPQYSEDEEISVDIQQVSQAAEQTSDRASESDRNEALTQALDRLIEAMRRRAGRLAEAGDEDMGELGAAILEAAKADDSIAGEEATLDLAMLVDSEAGTGRSKAERITQLAQSSRQVVEALHRRQGELRAELEDLRDTAAGLRDRIGERDASQRRLAASIADAAEAVLANDLEGIDAEELQERRSELAGVLGEASSSPPAKADEEPELDEVEVLGSEGGDGSDRLATAAAAVVEALRRREQDLAERILELEAKAAQGDEHERSAERLRGELDDARDRRVGLERELEAAVTELEDRERQAEEAEQAAAELREQLSAEQEQRAGVERQLETATEERARVDEDLSQARDQLTAEEERRGELERGLEEAGQAQERAAAELAGVREQLRQARAELEGYRARDQEAGGRLSTNQGKLREELEQARRDREAAEERLVEATEELESTIAGLRARTEDLDRRIEERDAKIHRLQADLDRDLEERFDSREGQARVEALRTELESERRLRAELEQQLDSYRGGVGDDLKAALRSRDELAEEVRRLEGEVSDQRGQAESLKAAKDKMRQDMAQQAERLRAEIEREREARERAEEADGDLREELAMLRARIKALTEDESDSANS